MLKLDGLRIRTTTYPESQALQSFYSYTLENTPFYFRLNWSPLKSDEFIKQFTNTKVIWNFGDGTLYTGPTAQHVYTWPGIYTVKATLLDVEGNTTDVFADEQLIVYNAMPDAVTIGGLDNNNLLYPLEAGRRTRPLKFFRYNSWQYDRDLRTNGYTVNLYASGSNSNYISVSSYYTSQWAHLKSYFGFIERSTTRGNVLSEKLIDSTITTSASVYAERVNTGNFDGNWNVRLAFHNYPKEGSVFCGTSGSELPDREIFFVDQKPSSQEIDGLVVIYATPDNNIIRDVSYYKSNIDSSYGVVNNTYSTVLLKSLYNGASSLAVTSNGITFEGGTDRGPLTAQSVYTFDIYPIKYVDAKIPFVVTFKDGNNFTTKCYPLLNLNNTGNLKLNDVSISLMEVFNDGSVSKLSGLDVQDNLTVPKFTESGSYYAGTITYPRTVTAATISAVAYVLDQPFNPPSRSAVFVMQPGLNLYRRLDRVYKYGYTVSKESFTVTENSEINTYGAEVSGGINISYVPGSVISPLSGEYVWITNADRDRIIVHDGKGNLRFSILLRRFIFRQDLGLGRFRNISINAQGPNNSSSPCGIAINRNGDAWVTLYDSVTSFKFEKTRGVAIAAIKPPLPDSILGLDYNDSAFYRQALNLKGFVGENLILPAGIDTDANDNVYISYTHPLCSFISKYDNNGGLIKVFPFNQPNTIKQILIDLDDNIWATSFSNENIDAASSQQSQKIVDRKDRVYFINQKENYITFKEFSLPGDLTMDINGYVWVNSRNNVVSRLSIELINNIPNIKSEDFPLGSENALDYVQDFGGMAGDLAGSLLVINNTESTLQYFNAKSPETVNVERIPSTPLPDTSKTDPAFNSNYYYKTIGDFTGVRWVLKNKSSYANVPRYVTGNSSIFAIKNSKSNSVIVKKNENYDMANTMKGYVLQESLFNNTNLFDNFLSPIINGEDNDLDELGKVIYEKISNYVENISDVDRCNINSLKSMYSMIGEELDLFLNTLPPSTRRIIDILSVKKCLLFGNVNNYNSNFTDICKKFDPTTNLGERLHVDKDYFIPGYPIVVYDNFSKRYRLIQNTIINEPGLTPFNPYPLSGINYNWGWGLVMENKDYKGSFVENFYKFYNFIPTTDTNFYDGLIDFKDEMTSISPYVSSYREWVKFGGQMDYIIGANLYQNLGLIK